MNAGKRIRPAAGTVRASIEAIFTTSILLYFSRLREATCHLVCGRRVPDAEELAVKLARTDLELRQANYVIERQDEEIEWQAKRIIELTESQKFCKELLAHMAAIHDEEQKRLDIQDSDNLPR